MLQANNDDHYIREAKIKPHSWLEYSHVPGIDLYRFSRLPVGSNAILKPLIFRLTT